MRTFIFVIALLFSGSAYAAPDCSNYGGSNLAGCGAEDFAVSSVQDKDMDQIHSVQERISAGRAQAGY